MAEANPMSAVVNCAAYAHGHKVADVALDDVSEVVNLPDRFLWIGLHEPSEELLRKVQEEFGLHDLAIEDAHRAHQRPKLERYGECLFIVLRTVAEEGKAHELRFGETHLFVGPHYVVSVRHGSSLSHVDVRARCEANPELLSQGPAFALYALMDFVVDQYFPVVDAMEDQLESLEEAVFQAAFHRETTERIYRLKRGLVEVKRAISPLVDVCNQLVRFDQALIPESTRPYFRDVYDHVVRINEMVDALRELLTAALEAHLSMVTVAQNDITKQLAAWAAIIAVPTMVAGVYGMNFQHMPELRWPWGYPALLAILVTACVLLHRRFKRAGWL
jgi:magnesium transporter